MFVTNWISTTKIQKISEITNFFRHYFLSRTEVDNLFLILFMKGRRGDESCAGNNVEADEFFGKNSYCSVPFCYKIRSFSLFPNLC